MKGDCMETIYVNRDNLCNWQEKARPSVMALGFFDGLHNGHCEVIKTALQEAKGKKCIFSSHEFLSPSENRDIQWKKTSVLFNAAV